MKQGLLLFILEMILSHYVVASEKQIFIQIDPHVESYINEYSSVKKDITDLFQDVLTFYKNVFPKQFLKIPQVIDVTIIPSISSDSMMEVHFPQNKISISWKKIKRWLYVFPDEDDLRVLQFNKTFLKAIVAHELSHVIHNESFLRLNEKIQTPLRHDPSNRNYREFISSVVEIMYLIDERGLPWVYQHHSAFYLLNNGLPPFTEKYLANHADSSIYRRWNAFVVTMVTSQCWVFKNQIFEMNWDEEKNLNCLRIANQEINSKLREWVELALNSAQFPGILFQDPSLETHSIEDAFLLGDEVLNQIITQAPMHIQSLVFPLSNVYKITQYISYKNSLEVTLEHLVELTNGWYIFRYHHFKGMFDPGKTQKYKIR
jgi:hypothetical protein